MSKEVMYQSLIGKYLSANGYIGELLWVVYRMLMPPLSKSGFVILGHTTLKI